MPELGLPFHIVGVQWILGHAASSSSCGASTAALVNIGRDCQNRGCCSYVRVVDSCVWKDWSIVSPKWQYRSFAHSILADAVEAEIAEEEGGSADAADEVVGE